MWECFVADSSERILVVQMVPRAPRCVWPPCCNLYARDQREPVLLMDAEKPFAEIIYAGNLHPWVVSRAISNDLHFYKQSPRLCTPKLQSPSGSLPANCKNTPPQQALCALSHCARLHLSISIRKSPGAWSNPSNGIPSSITCHPACSSHPSDLMLPGNCPDHVPWPDFYPTQIKDGSNRKMKGKRWENVTGWGVCMLGVGEVCSNSKRSASKNVELSRKDRLQTIFNRSHKSISS